MNRKSNGALGGCSVVGVLLIVFIVLKLTGLIGWSWVWVLSPLWIAAAILIAAVVGAAVIAVRMHVQDTRKDEEDGEEWNGEVH